MAGLAGVVRPYRVHRYAGGQCFVAHKRLQNPRKSGGALTAIPS
jgi:hypothetical protein